MTDQPCNIPTPRTCAFISRLISAQPPALDAKVFWDELKADLAIFIRERKSSWDALLGDDHTPRRIALRTLEQGTLDAILKVSGNEVRVFCALAYSDSRCKDHYILKLHLGFDMDRKIIASKGEWFDAGMNGPADPKI
jgi:hypothetical protein